MAKRCLVMLMFAVVCLAPAGAFADAQTIDFSCIMLFQPQCFDCYILHAEDDDFTRNTGLGILDIEEFGLLSLILADPAAPHHDEIHAAFKTNSELARAAIGATILTWTTPTATSGETARQPIPNTNPQLYYGADATMAAYVLLGEWDLYVQTMQAWKDSPFGSSVVVPTSSEGYVLLPERVCIVGDADDDGVLNCYEYWASSPRSWAGAIDPQATDAAAVWNVWASPYATPMKFAYNADTQRVYAMIAPELTWQEAINTDVIYFSGRFGIDLSLVTIRDAQEQLFVDSLIEDGTHVWIGCTDAGRDTGHTAPNPLDWYWFSDLTQSQMTYTAWATGQPNGVDGAEDCAVMRGSQDGGFTGWTAARWYDMSEYNGTPPAPRKYPAIFELTSLYEDSDSDGAPDDFEDNNGDLLPDGFVSRYMCDPRGQISAEGVMLNEVLLSDQTPAPDLKALLTALSMTTWPAWDIEGIEANFPPAELTGAGDGLPDAAQVALIEYVACTPTVDAHDEVAAGMTTNKTLWDQDLGDLGAYDPEWYALQPFSNLFPALIGSSLEMKNTVNALIHALSGGDTHLPSYPDYVVFGAAKSATMFSADGDLDGDGKTNMEEYTEVVAAGGGLDTFVDAATDPNNIWPGNPELPVGGVSAAGLLAASLLAGAAAALRRKR